MIDEVFEVDKDPGDGAGIFNCRSPGGLADQLPLFPGTPGVKHEVHGCREKNEGDEMPDDGLAR